MDIYNPPQSYIDWRCATFTWEIDPHNTKEQFDRIRAKFYKDFSDFEDEILEFCRWLNKARSNLSLPVELREVVEDGKGTWKKIRMMIYDIRYFRDRGRLHKQKTYLPLESSYTHEPPNWGPSYSFYKSGKRKMLKMHQDLEKIVKFTREPGEEG